MNEGRLKAGRRVSVAVKGVLVWLAVFTPSIAVGALIAFLGGSAVLGAVVTQVLFLALSVVIAGLVLKRGYRALGFRGVSLSVMVKAFILSLTIAVSMAYVGLHLVSTQGFKPPVPGIVGNAALYLLVALVLAPVCEETLFRGVLLGYMLEEGAGPRVSVVVSAAVFSLAHLLPFSTAPLPQRVLVVCAAFVAGVIAGALRVRTGSIVPAVITHSCFNLGGSIASCVGTIVTSAHMLVAVLVAVGMSLLVLVLSSGITGLVAKHVKGMSEATSGALTQALIVVTTLVMAFLVLREPSVLGSVSAPPTALAEGVACAGLIALALTLATSLLRKVAEECKPPVKFGSVWELAVLVFLVAPVGEELLFRGLVEGYLLASGVGLHVSVVVPALLFSLMHVAPFKSSGKFCLVTVLASAFVLGVVAGFFRAVTGSITIPIVIHAMFNLPSLRRYAQYRKCGAAQPRP